jgi:hypothetical protein
MLLRGSFFGVLPSRRLTISTGEMRALTSALRLLPRRRVVRVSSELISGDPVQFSQITSALRGIRIHLRISPRCYARLADGSANGAKATSKRRSCVFSSGGNGVRLEMGDPVYVSMPRTRQKER